MKIQAKFDHFNFNVFDLDKSIAFYQKALGLKEVRRRVAEDGSFILVFMGEERSDFVLELTWLKDREKPYDLGELEYHLCIRADNDYAEMRQFHRDMGCICYENESMGLYFIADPDGYWIEVLQG